MKKQIQRSNNLKNHILKHIFISKIALFLLIITPTLLSAQDYQIDLSNVEYPIIKEDFDLGNPGSKGKEIKVNSLYMTKGNKPVLPVMGEFHFSRYDHRYWRETLLKMKASGVNIVSTYVLWIYHEEIEGKMNWDGNNNLREFVQLCDEIGLMVHLRIGPYCNAECRNGGLPDWLMKKKYIRKRYNDPLYLNYARKWYRAVAQQVDGLLYKDGGPIIGLQIENEYVTKGHIVDHLMALKKIAMEEGFDVPVYSMTHWMSTNEAPNKDIIPYAGYYIETPWTAGYGELPVSNFQFYSYNRIADNIATDLITFEGDVQSLNSQEAEAPYFTCEVGLGTPTFNRRRPIVPEEMAGQNINLRLGSGVNLMGYYMYSGGSNQLGELTSLESGTCKISYDYQAPIREFGTLGVVMNETKKLNYFMNDFGEQLATEIAYLPNSNNDTDNLQWSVRLKDNKGFLFCSNYLYKQNRKNYKDVQFNIVLENETIKIPRKPVTIVNQAYFLWPFNLELDQVQLKYATTQPISKLNNKNDKLWVFFQDDEIPAEYFFAKNAIEDIHVTAGTVREESEGYFVSELNPGKDCLIKIEQKDGSIIKILTLTEKESDKVWKVKNEHFEYLVISESGLFFENKKLTLFSENNKQAILIYPPIEKSNSVKGSIFSSFTFEKEKLQLPVDIAMYRPMEKSWWIKPSSTESKYLISKSFDVSSLAAINQAILRCAASDEISVFVNDKEIKLQANGNYFTADLTTILKNERNTIRVESKTNELQFIGEIEAFFDNGRRMVWNTDNTWETGIKRKKKPVILIGKQGVNGSPTFEWNKKDQVAYFEIKLPSNIIFGKEELRLALTLKGDIAEAYLGEDLINDYLYDGSTWLIGINRFKERLHNTPLLIKIKAFPTAQPKIYLEKYVDRSGLDKAQLEKVELQPEYRFYVKLTD